MNILEIISGVLLLISGILIIILVILQESKQAGMSGAIDGGASGSDSYMDRNGGRTIDAKLARMTKFLAAIFFIITLAVNIVTVVSK